MNEIRSQALCFSVVYFYFSSSRFLFAFLMLSSEGLCWIGKHEGDICAESENMKEIFVRHYYVSKDERRKEKKRL